MCRSNMELHFSEEDDTSAYEYHINLPRQSSHDRPGAARLKLAKVPVANGDPTHLIIVDSLQICFNFPV